MPDLTGRTFGTIRLVCRLSAAEVAGRELTPSADWYVAKCTRCGRAKPRRGGVLARQAARTDPPFRTGCARCTVLLNHPNAKRDKLVLKLKRRGKLSLRRIGERVGISKSRVWQICQRTEGE